MIADGSSGKATARGWRGWTLGGGRRSGRSAAGHALSATSAWPA